MSGLLDEIAAHAATPGGTCSIGILLNELPPDERADLETALDARYGHSAIGAALRARGHAIGDGTVSRHRRRLCLCR